MKTLVFVVPLALIRAFHHFSDYSTASKLLKFLVWKLRIPQMRTKPFTKYFPALAMNFTEFWVAGLKFVLFAKVARYSCILRKTDTFEVKFCQHLTSSPTPSLLPPPRTHFQMSLNITTRSEISAADGIWQLLLHSLPLTSNFAKQTTGVSQEFRKTPLLHTKNHQISLPKRVVGWRWDGDSISNFRPLPVTKPQKFRALRARIDRKCAMSFFPTMRDDRYTFIAPPAEKIWKFWLFLDLKTVKCDSFLTDA